MPCPAAVCCQPLSAGKWLAVLQVCAGHALGEQGVGPGCAGQSRVGAGRVEDRRSAAGYGLPSRQGVGSLPVNMTATCTPHLGSHQVWPVRECVRRIFLGPDELLFTRLEHKSAFLALP